MPKSGHALAIAEGMDRDRAVDESGNQIAVFGRVGARPLSLEDQRKMYLHDDQIWKVSDNPRSAIYQKNPGISQLKSPIQDKLVFPKKKTTKPAGLLIPMNPQLKQARKK